MKTLLLTVAVALALSGCGGGDDSGAPTPIPPDNGGSTSEDVLAQCENQGCTLDEAVTTHRLTVTDAPIILTNQASIILE